MAKQYDIVELTDGTKGNIIEVFEPGHAYLFEWATPNGDSPFDDRTIYENEIKQVIGHV